MEMFNWRRNWLGGRCTNGYYCELRALNSLTSQRITLSGESVNFEQGAVEYCPSHICNGNIARRLIVSLKTTIPVLLMFPLLRSRRATRPKAFIKSAANGSNYSKELFSYPGGTFLKRVSLRLV